MKIEQRKTDELIPYERNQKKHDEKQVQNVANSIKRFGWQQPIVVDRKGVIVIGHCRWMAAKKLGLAEVPVTVADDLTEDEIRELRIADNKTNESEWDEEKLKIDAEELGFDGFDFDFGLGDMDSESVDDTYTSTVNPPQYEIKGVNPALDQLYDRSKADALIEQINSANLPYDVSEFLKAAATRHIRFNYKNIAEFYAHADEQTQELMECSALVIIDVNDAIANGYAVLRDEIDELMSGDEDE